MATLLERKKEIEDKVVGIIDPLTDAEKWVAYAYLRHLGYSMNQIEFRIDDAIRRELKNGSQTSACP